MTRLRAFLSQPVPYWYLFAWTAASTVGVLIVWWTR